MRVPHVETVVPPQVTRGAEDGVGRHDVGRAAGIVRTRGIVGGTSGDGIVDASGAIFTIVAVIVPSVSATKILTVTIASIVFNLMDPLHGAPSATRGTYVGDVYHGVPMRSIGTISVSKRGRRVRLLTRHRRVRNSPRVFTVTTSTIATTGRMNGRTPTIPSTTRMVDRSRVNVFRMA